MTDIVSSDLTGILLQYGDDTPINITALQVQEGDNTPVAVWAEEYTLSITKTNPGYIKSAIVNRTASQYGHGATGELSNGATLYYGDTLTAAATAADTTTSYTEWVPAAIADPTFTNKTDTSVQVNNPNAFAVTLYYKLSTASSYTSVAIAASSSTTLSGLTAGSEYEFYFTASKSRTKTVTTYSVTKSWASLTVDSNESITFTGAASPVESTESGTLTSNTASYTMPYKITLTKNANVASISLTYTKVGASSRTTVRTAGTYYAEALSYFNWSATAATGYVLDHSSGQSWIVNECTIAPIASRQTFTITFALGGSNYGSWSTASIAVEYGDTISRSGNTVTIKKWDDASANRGISTFTNGSTTGYDYSVSYNDITSPITADQTVTATTSRTRKTFTITFALGGSNYGSWSKSSITAQYGDTISRSGNTVTVYKWDDTSTARDSSTFTNGSATEYTYSVSYNTPTSPITAAQTITATTSRSRKTFTITFALGGSNYGSWSKSSITAQYGDTISRSGNVVTIYKWDATSTARDSSTFANGSATGYTYSVSYNTPTSPITAAQTMTATTSRTANDYNITITKNTGISTIYYKVNGASSWTSTTASTTVSAKYASTVYWYAKAATEYNGNNVGSSSSPNSFTMSTSGTIAPTATRKSFTITIGLTRGTGDSTSTWDSTTSITAYYGDYIQRSGNVVTIYQWDATTTARATRTLTLDAAYNASYTNAPTTKTQLNRDTTLAVSATTSRKSFSVTIALTKGTGDSASAWDSTTSITAYYGDYIQRSGNVVTIYKWDATTTARATRTLTVATGYNASYTNAPTTKTQLNRSSTLAVSATTARKSFTITFAKAGTSSGSWSSATITAQYGDTISRSGNIVTIKKWDDSSVNRGTSTFTPTTGYNVSYNSISSPITAAQTITATTSVKSFTYSTGTLPTGVASITCTRASSPLGGASTGTVANGGTIYYNDTIYFTATAATGYNNPTSSKTSSSPLTVTAAVTGANYVTAGSVKSYTYTTGTLPTGVASITCTRSSSPYKGASTGTVANNGTIYYGDKLYFTATASSGYNAPSVPNYYDSSHTLTVSSNVQGKNYVTAGSAAGSWHTVWTGSQALKVGTDPGDPSMAYGDTTISGLSHIITSSTPLQVKVTTRYGNSGWVSASNEPVKFSESRKSGSRTSYCESSVWAPDYASSTSVTITARFDDQSSGLLLFPSITATEIQACY